MPDTPTVQETPAVKNENPQGAAGAANEAPGTPDPTEPPEGAQGGEEALWSGIPEDHPVREVLRSTRAEAAERRTLARSLQESNEALKAQLEGAKTPEEFAAAVADYEGKVAEANLAATKERVGRIHGLPDALVGRLNGSTEEELTADAEALKALLPPAQSTPPPPAPKDPPSGGLTPHKRAIAAKEAAENIRRRAGNPLGG